MTDFHLTLNLHQALSISCCISHFAHSLRMISIWSHNRLFPNYIKYLSYWLGLDGET